METGLYCPEHPDLKISPFQNECMTCNKPLQARKAYTEKPDPPVVEDLENTVYDRRIDIPEEKERRTKTEVLRDEWNEAEEKEIVARRLAELEEPLERQPLTPEKITAAPEPRPFKTFREKIEDKAKAKAHAKPHKKEKK